MNKTTSRERVLTALRHEEPDRVPIDLGSMRSSGIHAVAYNRLKAYLGMADGETRIFDVMQQLAYPETAVVDRLGADAAPSSRVPFGMDPARPGWKAWRLADGSGALMPDGLNPYPAGDGWELKDEAGGVLYRMPASGLYFDRMHGPLYEATTVAEIEAWPGFTISEAELEWLRVEAKRVRESTAKAIVALTSINVYEGAQNARGWQQFMEDLGGAPHLAEALLQRLADSAIEVLDKYLDAVGPYVDIVQVGDDLGSQGGPQISLRMYRRMVKPRQQQVWQFIKEKTGLPVFLHCCGGVYPLIPDLIEAGVDILNPVQTTAAGMDPVRLKAEFGRDLVFWGGGADTQHILPEGTPQEVADHVKQQIDILAPGGGFVFTQVHNIQANVPPENIVAMFEAAMRYGGYEDIRSRPAVMENPA